MGKRELLIVAAFAVIGVAVYWVTATPSPNAPRRFSLAAFMDTFRRGRGARGMVSASREGTIPVSPALTEVLVSNVVAVTLIGEDRSDISYQMTVESAGPDPQAARGLASGVDLEADNAGAALSLRPSFAHNVRQTARLVLHVPSRIAARIDGADMGATVEASGLAGLEIEGVIGDVHITDIVGPVTGTHRNGDLTITRAGGATLTLFASDATLTDVKGPVTVVARNGRTRLDHVAGAISVDQTNQDVSIVAPADAVEVTGTGGAVSVDTPRRAVKIDVHHASINLALNGAVLVSALTSDAPLHLLLSGTPPIALDATATDGGTIHAEDVALTPETSGHDVRIAHTFGRGTARVELLDQRGDIVIGMSK